MRSHVVLEGVRIFGRFQLCRLAAEATRKLHKPGDRIQNTTNDALRRLAGADLKISGGRVN